MVRFEADSAATLETIREDISSTFPDVLDEEYSTSVKKARACFLDTFTLEVLGLAVGPLRRELESLPMILTGFRK